MKELKLIDRVVVEIFAEQGNEFSYQLVAEQLHMIADAIEEGRKGGDWHDEDLTQLHGVDGVPMEVLWEHESQGYGDFRIVSDKSLIRPYYYGSEPKPKILGDDEFLCTTLTRTDLEWKGFKAEELNDDTMEVIASKAGDYMLDDVGYWDAIIASADWHGIPHKEEEPEIMVADLAGRMVGWDKWQQVYYLGAGYGHNDGVVYKNQQAFDEHNGICYIPEAGFFDQSGMEEKISEEMQKWLDEQDHCGYVSDGSGGYTRDDLYAAFADHINYDGWLDEKEKEYGKPFMEEFIDKEIAYIFQELDWQCPSTFMDEMEWDADWEEFIKDRLDDPRLTEKQKKELGYE